MLLLIKAIAVVVDILWGDLLLLRHSCSDPSSSSRRTLLCGRRNLLFFIGLLLRQRLSSNYHCYCITIAATFYSWIFTRCCATMRASHDLAQVVPRGLLISEHLLDSCGYVLFVVPWWRARCSTTTSTLPSWRLLLLLSMLILVVTRVLIGLMRLLMPVQVVVISSSSR